MSQRSYHSMATVNLNKSEEFVTNNTAASKYIPRRPRISINWNPPFQTFFTLCFLKKIKNQKISDRSEIFFCFTIHKKLNKSCYSKKNFFWNFMKWGLKGGISIDADSGPPRYVIWCCGSICYELLNFIQIGCGHTVHRVAVITVMPHLKLHFIRK